MNANSTFLSSANRCVVALCGAIASSLVSLPAWANPPETAPAELTQLLENIDAAASSADVDAVMDFYSSDFVHEDGLTRSSLRSALVQLWERFPELTYETELLSWEATETGYETQTRTTIAGTEAAPHRQYDLNATLQSRQRYENGEIVFQEVLAERATLTSGDAPPTVTVNLPESVRPNSRYHFDAIVQEPLDNDFLLGSAIEQTVSVDNYLDDTALELQLLSAGGLFKVGETEAREGDYWLSGAIVRRGGITIVTQRMKVKK
ncbi:nuclear transport factor 2 family protein [Baaleninema sp.]|uniref:nuclear transport factor 2 family protein n=1 Tax=Baaleninema sp. TaxID=3101197 RepID=UPI003D0384DC